MFVAMGLSAVFPVLHGLKLYGIEQMRDRIGLTWLVLQGALYILGAGLYAVSHLSISQSCMDTDVGRLVGLNVLVLGHLTYGEARTRYFMCLLSWLLHRIFTGC